MLERLALPLRGLSNAIASFMKGLYGALGGPGRLLEDVLNGTWLGHSLHAVLVDVVIGGATVALLLDLLRVIFGVGGLEDAATWTMGLVFLSALGAVLTGLTDYKDTSPDSAARDVAGLHGLINLAASVGFGISLWLRIVGSHDAGFWVLLVSYLVVSVGGYIGGHIVFKYGYMVNFNAFSRRETRRRVHPRCAGDRRAREHADEGHVRRDRDHAGPSRRGRVRPEGHLLARGWAVVAGHARRGPDHLSMALLDLPHQRWLRGPRTGLVAPGLVSSTRQRRAGGGPGAARLIRLPRRLCR